MMGAGMARVAFLGLGVMGGPMARHLASKGHAVTVYNRTAAKAEAWVAAHGGSHAPTPRDAARDADFVMACVGNDDDLRAVCLGPDGAFAGMKAGLDGAAVVEVISQGAAGSWQMVNRHKSMLEGRFDFGFAVDWMRKDLGICLDTADQIGASLPVTALVDQFYKDVQRMGGGRNDTSSLIRRLNVPPA